MKKNYIIPSMKAYQVKPMSIICDSKVPSNVVQTPISNRVHPTSERDSFLEEDEFEW